MPDNPTEPEHSKKKRRNFFQVPDFAWLLFVGILIGTAPETNYDALILLPLIGAFQILEPRLRLFDSKPGRIVSLALKLILSFLLVGWTHTIFSYYYQIFLIPVVSAATTFELGTVVLVTFLAGALYFSFLLPIFFDYSRYQLPPDQIEIMSLRVAFFAIVAFLVYEQARAKRQEMERTHEAALQLAESNRSLRETQVSLRRSERLAALGQLTAGLAHELRNPLATIKASAEMLTKQTVQNQPAVRAEMAEYIGTEVNRMNSLISSFLSFARPLQIQPALADFRQLALEVRQQQLAAAQDRNVNIALEIPDGEWEFGFDRNLISVVLTNLLQNAVQASSPGQNILLTASRFDGKVQISVKDQGEGIPAQNLESIFNPFFTTKPQGVGLGLPIVAKIIDEHDGRIAVTSEPGKGTTFEITLPA